MTTKFEAGDEVLIRGVLENNVTAYTTNYPLKLVIKGDLIGTFTEDGRICYSNFPILELVKKGKLPFGQVRRSKDSYCTAFVLEDDGETVFYRYRFEGEKDWYAFQKDKNDFLEFYSEIVDQQK